MLTRFSATYYARDLFQYIFDPKRFGENELGSSLTDSLSIDAIAPAGDEAEGEAFVLCAKSLGQPPSIQFRHAEITQNQVWPSLTEDLQTFQTVASLKSSVATFLKDLNQ